MYNALHWILHYINYSLFSKNGVRLLIQFVLSEYQYIFIFGILFYILTLTLTVCCICVISCVVLEGEMYQLSHLLTDQKTVMTSMMELSITGNKGKLDVCNNYSWQGP